MSKTHEYANYVQGIEGGIDTVHSSFLHNTDRSNKKSFKHVGTAPRLEVERTDYGIRNVGEANYARMYRFAMPFQEVRSERVNFGAGDGVEDVLLIKGHTWAKEWMP